MKTGLDSKNAGDLFEGTGIALPTIQPGLGGVDSASRDFEKYIQRNFDSSGYLSRRTTQDNGIVEELSVIDRLDSYEKRNTRDISFTF